MLSENRIFRLGYSNFLFHAETEIISAVTVSISAKWFEEVAQYKDFDAQAFLKDLKIKSRTGNTLTGSYNDISEVKQMLERKLVELKAKTRVHEIESDDMNTFVRDSQKEKFIQSSDGVGCEPDYEPGERSELPSANSGVEISILGGLGNESKEKELEKDDPLIKEGELKGGQQRDEVQHVSSDKEKNNEIGNHEKTYADVAKISINAPTVESTNQQIETNDVAGLNAIDKTPEEVEVVPKCRARHRQNDNFQVFDIPEGIAIEELMVGVESVTKTTDAKIEWNKSDKSCTISGSSAAVNSIVKALDEMITSSMIKDQDGFNTDPCQADQCSGLDAQASGQNSVSDSNQSFDRVVRFIEILDSVSYDAALDMIKTISNASKVDIELENDAKRLKLFGHSKAIENIKKALDGMTKSIAKLNCRDTDESRQNGVDNEAYNSVENVDNLAVVHPPPNKYNINTTDLKNGSVDFNDNEKSADYKTDQAESKWCDNSRRFPDHFQANRDDSQFPISAPSNVIVNQPGRRHFAIEYDSNMTLILKSTTIDLKVLLYKADITQQRTDVIVNSTDVTLSDKGMLSCSIMQKAGFHVQMECKNIIDNSGPISRGNVVSTTAGELGPAIKRIIHAVGPNRADVTLDRNQAQSLHLHRAYFHSLMYAATEIPVMIQSISFPLISASALGTKGSSHAAFAAIKEFDIHWSSYYPAYRTKLSEVHIVCLYAKELVDAIETFRMAALTSN